MLTQQDTDRNQHSGSAPLGRVSGIDREYSSHVPGPDGLSRIEPSIAKPQPAHISDRDLRTSQSHAAVTTRPSVSTLESKKTTSSTSSPLTAYQIEAAEDIFESARLEASRRVVRDVQSKETTIRTVEQDQWKRSGTTTCQVEPADHYSDRIATQERLNDLVTAFPLPQVRSSSQWLSLRYGFFSTYRRLHALVLVANLVAIFVMIARAVRHPVSFTYQEATTAVAANLFVGTLMRHEHCVNFLFRLAIVLPPWIPLSIRRHAAKVYSYGGIHSACGISAFLWYIFFAVLIFDQYHSDAAWETQTLAVVTALILVVFLMLICLAHPGIRQRWHDIWEITHRIGGWLGVALVWTQLLIVVIAASSRNGQNSGIALLQQPAFWFLLIINFFIIYPWLRLRRLAVTSEVLSPHAVRLHFDNRNQKTCKGIRLSTSPVLENHGFATIPNPDGEKGYSALVSRAGDWTGNIITNPPEHIWSRGAPTTGVARVAQLFKSVVLVATGSGIGPCMSWLVPNPMRAGNGRLIWSARFPEKTYGPKLMAQVFYADEEALIIDTKATGRKPHLLDVVWAVYREVGAEAVIIISNPKVTKEVVLGLESRRVPAYGAIFDS